MEKTTEDTNALDVKQSASAAQFNRQSDRYGKSHILADTQDVEQGLRGLIVPASGTALDVATGGGHTALWLARHGWKEDGKIVWWWPMLALLARKTSAGR